MAADPVLQKAMSQLVYPKRAHAEQLVRYLQQVTAITGKTDSVRPIMAAVRAIVQDIMALAILDHSLGHCHARLRKIRQKQVLSLDPAGKRLSKEALMLR